MGQVLRITFKQNDYNFQILNTGQISKSTRELLIQVNGSRFTLVKNNQKWMPVENDEPEKVELATAIGKTIALRYRI